MNCVSTPVGGVESEEQNLNNEFLDDIYIDKRYSFSIIIPKGWEIKYEDDKSVLLMGLMVEYNIAVTGALVLLNNTSLSVSDMVDGLIVEITNNKLGKNLTDPQKGSINISTTDLQGEYIKILVDQDGKISLVKIYYIPHRNENSIMMITCAATPIDNVNVNLDMVFDKFVKTFNWIR
jgi:hypothetical protein